MEKKQNKTKHFQAFDFNISIANLWISLQL